MAAAAGAEGAVPGSTIWKFEAGQFIVASRVRIRALYQWEFQDPKMEVLYHIRPYFVGIFPYIGLI